VTAATDRSPQTRRLWAGLDDLNSDLTYLQSLVSELQDKAYDEAQRAYIVQRVADLALQVPELIGDVQARADHLLHLTRDVVYDLQTDGCCDVGLVSDERWNRARALFVETQL
jgi:hypothetical protein